MTEIKRLFQLSDQMLEEWRSTGLLQPTRIGRGTYVLYFDLLCLFRAAR